MGRPARPWYRAERDGWFVKVNGRQVGLGVRGRGGEMEAIRRWHLLLEGRPFGGPPAPAAVRGTVGAAWAAYLGHFGAAAGPKRVAVALWAAAPFLAKFGRDYGVPAGDAAAWLASRTTWNPTSRRDAHAVLGRFFRWAVGKGLLASDPMPDVPRPPPARRPAPVVTAAGYAALRDAAPPPLRDLMAVLWLTGCRPGEASRLAAADLDLAAGVAVLTAHKTAAKTGRPRLIPLPDAAVEMLRGLAAARPDGPLLRNRCGRPWLPSTVGAAFDRLRKRTGVRCTAYHLRHTFATDALSQGVPDALVAAALGHASTQMIHAHYSHLSERTRQVRDALKGVR